MDITVSADISGRSFQHLNHRIQSDHHFNVKKMFGNIKIVYLTLIFQKDIKYIKDLLTHLRIVFNLCEEKRIKNCHLSHLLGRFRTKD